MRANIVLSSVRWDAKCKWMVILMIGLLVCGSTSFAADVIKEDNATALNDDASWIGIAPSAGDVAVWDNTVTTANSVALGADLSWQGIKIQDPGGAVAITAGNTLTLGTGGIDMSTATRDLSLANAISLGDAQIWNTAIGRTITASGVISGAGGLTKSGDGTLTMTADNSYSGGTTISGGTIQLGSTTALGATSGGLVINTGGTLDISGRTIGGRAVTLAGGLITNSGADQSSAISGGSLTVTADSRIGGTGRMDIRNGSTVTVNSGATLTKEGSGLLHLNVSSDAANTVINGMVDITDGLLYVYGVTTSGTGSFRVSTGAKFVLSGGYTLNDNTVSLDLAGGSLVGGTQSGAVTVSADSVLGDAGIIGLSMISGNISGSNALKFIGPSGAILSGNNSFSGMLDMDNAYLTIDGIDAVNGKPSVNISSGALKIGEVFVGGTATFGSLSGTGGTIDPAWGGTAGTRTFGFEQTTDGEFAGSIIDAGSRIIALTKSGNAKLTLSGANTYTGGTTISEGVLQIGNGGTTGNLLGNAINNDRLAFNRSDDYTYAGVISGTGKVAQLGSGTLTLTNAHTYTGATSVVNGELAVNGSLESPTIVYDGAKLSGIGTISGGLSMQAGSTLAPGASPGTLTINGGLSLDGADLAIDIWGAEAGTQYDVINLATGALSLANAPTITVDLGDDYDPDLLSNFTIITGIESWTGDWGAVSVVNAPQSWTDAGKAFEISQGSVMLTVIPEPNTIGLLMLIGIAAMIRRLRMR